MHSKMANAVQFCRDKKILLRCWILFVLAMIVLVGTTAPFHTAYACNPLNVICGLVEFVQVHLASAIITAISMIFIFINIILSIFEIIAGVIMSAVINWIQVVPYTPINQALIQNATNPITTGWSIMRDLADMGLIFVLIAIAIATILNISFGKEYGKTLLMFIGVAIIINFSPLITGVIIDISNILTGIFFHSAGDAWHVFAGNATLGVGSAGDFLKSVANSFTADDITIPLSFLISSIVSIVLTLTVSVAFVVMTFLLLARVLALWILVILSPIAFLMAILPSTQQHFQKWWHNFFQWAMIPIPLGLSYYLSATMVQGLSTTSGVLCKGFNGNIVGGASNVGGSFSALMAKTTIFSNFCAPMILVMAVAFLFVGFFISFSASAIGSKMVVAQGTKWGSRIGAGAARFASTRVAAPLAAAGGRGIQRAAGATGRGIGAGAGWTGRRIGGIQTKIYPAPKLYKGGKGGGSHYGAIPYTVGELLTKAQGQAAAGAKVVAGKAGQIGAKIPGAAGAAGLAAGAAQKGMGAARAGAGAAMGAAKQYATPEKLLGGAARLPATILDIPPDKIAQWLNNMKKPMSMTEALKQGVGPGVFSGLGQASQQFNPTAFQGAYAGAQSFPWNSAASNPADRAAISNLMAGLGSQTFEQQMARLYLLVQNGLGLILNEQRLQDKKLVEDRKKVYEKIALLDPNAFKQLAKKVPDVRINAPVTVLQKVFGLKDEDMKTERTARDAAQNAILRSIGPQDLDGDGRIPEEALRSQIDSFVMNLPREQKKLDKMQQNIKKNYSSIASEFETKASAYKT